MGLHSSLYCEAFFNLLRMKYHLATLEFINKGRLFVVDRLVRLNLSQDVSYLFIASVVGLAAGLGAVLFHEAIALVQDSLFVKLYRVLDEWPFQQYAIIVFPALGGLIVGVISYYSPPDALGHGVPDVIKSVIARGGYMKSSLAFFKTLVSAFSIGSGGAAGREGPIVQIGASLGSAVGQFFRMSSDQLRTLVAAGAAGGIAAIFNAPLGGVMFSLEIIIGGFSVRTFSPIVISAVLATAVSRSYLGDHPTFVPTDYALASNYELFFYLLLGLMCGVVSVWFNRVLFATEDFLQRFRKIPRMVQPALGGIVVGLVLFWLPGIAGFSYAVNNDAILGRADIFVLAAVVLLKPIVVGITLGSGGSGGVLAPALKMGAAFGGLAGLLFHSLFPEYTAGSGAYALVGMGALLAGTMHAPLTAIIMIFEISDTYEVILPIMFAAVSASVVARMIMRDSVYTHPLRRQGIEIGYGINLSIIHTIEARSLLTKKFASVKRTSPVNVLVRLVEENDQSVFPVVDGKNVIVGLVRFQELRALLRDSSTHEFILAEDVMMKNFPLINKRDTLDKVLKQFELADVDAMPVVADGEGKELVGLIRHEDVLRRYRKEILLRSEH